MNEAETSLPCPYCGQAIEAGTRYPLIQQRKLADHKARCPQKRYLGGELEIGGALPDPL